jgi:hypothetical protein
MMRIILSALVLTAMHPPDPPQINVIVRLANPASMDDVARRLASRLHMRMTISGEGIIEPPGAHGIQVYDEGINFFILPTAVDPCSMREVYDGTTYSVGIVAVRPDAERRLSRAERELRNTVSAAHGTVSPVLTC